MSFNKRLGSNYPQYLLLFVVWLFSAGANAAAPQIRTQAPGYYRMMVGDFEVTALSDGTSDLPADSLLAQTANKTSEELARSFLRAPVESSDTAYLVNTGSKLVLIDTGAGVLLGPTLGKLLANLRAAGYTPEQVDEVYLTHLHPDHVGGLLAGDTMAFPNAVVRADKRDTDYWLSPQAREAAPKSIQRRFDLAMKAFAPYLAKGGVAPFDGAAQLLPGIRAVPAYGHTPGHTMYAVESRGQKLVLCGDLAIVAAVQVPDPAVSIAFDSQPAVAVAARTAVFADAAKEGYWLGMAHFAFPGLGHLRRDSTGYTFVPINYSQLR